MINPFTLRKNAERIALEIDNYVRKHPEEFQVTDEQYTNATYKYETCDICGQRGCEFRTRTIAGTHYYHNKCFELINKFSEEILNDAMGVKK